MSGKAAARKGDKTDHEETTLVAGPGAANTEINGKPAWRANADVKLCTLDKPAPHVPEIAKYGSYSVLIEGEMAVRVEDHCLGSTFPAEVTEGSSDVIIGDTLDGLAARIGEFCKAFCAMLEKFPEMTEAEHRVAMEGLMNDQLDAIGVPPIEVELTGGGLGGGAFSWWDWKLDVDKGIGFGTLLPEEKTELSKVLLHETRHAEQLYRAGQHAAGQPGADLASVMAETDLPANVAQSALDNPVTDDVLGESVYESIYGEGSGYRNQTHSDLQAGNDGGYERYRTLPEEHDAWDVDDLTNCTCPEKK